MSYGIKINKGCTIYDMMEEGKELDKEIKEIVEANYKYKSDKQIIKDVELKVSSAKRANLKTILYSVSEVATLLDTIRRQQNLIDVQNVFLDKAGLAVKCNGCPFIEDCIYMLSPVEDCVELMSNRAKTL